MFPSLWTNIWSGPKCKLGPRSQRGMNEHDLQVCSNLREDSCYTTLDHCYRCPPQKCSEFFGRRSGIHGWKNRGLWDRDVKQDFFPRLNWAWFVNYCLSFIFYYQLWLHEYCWLEKQTNQTVEKLVMEKIVMCVRLVGWIADFFKYFFKILVIETSSPFIA